ncbi:hypothetical protein LO762_16690 [Actinocorallia sp. API 0066]|uniref:hypothetical protein n=1 Tax=Actinocorallia sp. API 0066 TaxID=2896846 RepID=UPI001E2B7E1E|nr:hypothetical protein [Actinocorallia sp. API 0066]MCD0450817.1 hypothetical protein [Actinocorallia sp. API 0066]
MISAKTRLLLATPLLALALGTASACSSENADCALTTGSCTVTFDRGVDAKASVLGVDAQLVEATDSSVTVKIGGQNVTVPLDGEEQSGNFSVRVKSITQDQVVLEIATGVTVTE